MFTAAVFMVQAAPVLAENHGGKNHKMEEVFQETDTNADGQISRDEYLSHVQKRASEKFASKDSNGDGMLTMDESKSYYQSKKEGRKDKMKEKMQERKEEMKEMRMMAPSDVDPMTE